MLIGRGLRASGVDAAVLLGGGCAGEERDPDTPIEETMDTLQGFVQVGKVRYVGCSNFTARRVVEAQWAAERHGARGFVSLQAHYSLLAREIEAEAEILPTCVEHRLGVLVYAPLGGGVLAGRYTRGADPEPGTRMGYLKSLPHPAAGRWADAYLDERNFDIAEEAAAIASEARATSAAVALVGSLDAPMSPRS